MKNLLSLSFRSIHSRKKQFLSLYLVILFGLGICFFCIYLLSGMRQSLEEKAKIYYGGDFQLIGETHWLGQGDFENLKTNVQQVFPGSILSPRYDFDAAYAAYYYEGVGVRQRVIKGIDFSLEEELFSQFNYVEGDCLNMYHSNGVLLSAPVAEMLQVHAGDEITFLLRTSGNVINTVPLVVRGIFKDSSLFGMYTSYMDKDLLLESYGMPKNIYNRFCIMLPADTKKENPQFYQKQLEQILPMFHLVKDKSEFYNAQWKLSMPTYALIPLSANLEDLEILIEAMGYVAGFIILILVVIIVVGVSCTFRVIVIKRSKEIGLYRALGMSGLKIMIMLLREVLILLLGGCFSGFVFSLILRGLSLCVNLSGIPGFDVFLSNGYLSPVIMPEVAVGLSVFLISVTLLGVALSIRKLIKVSPADAISSKE